MARPFAVLFFESYTYIHSLDRTRLLPARRNNRGRLIDAHILGGATPELSRKYVDFVPVSVALSRLLPERRDRFARIWRLLEVYETRLVHNLRLPVWHEDRQVWDRLADIL